MLDFEAALARAESIAGVIPSSAASCDCRQVPRGIYSMSEKLSEAAGLAGNLAIPLVNN